MKKLLFNAFIAIACIALFSSCAKEETFDKNYLPLQNEVSTEKGTPTHQDQDTYECGTGDNPFDENNGGGCGG